MKCINCNYVSDKKIRSIKMSEKYTQHFNIKIKFRTNNEYLVGTLIIENHPLCYITSTKAFSLARLK